MKKETDKFIKELFGKENDAFERRVIKTKHFNPRRLVRLMVERSPKNIKKTKETLWPGKSF